MLCRDQLPSFRQLPSSAEVRRRCYHGAFSGRMLAIGIFSSGLAFVGVRCLASALHLSWWAHEAATLGACVAPWWLVMVWRWRRARARLPEVLAEMGYCAHCGHDLSRSAVGRCPECESERRPKEYRGEMRK